jgi:riboflavin biosynthesis pyrimidine reductase
MVTGLDGVVSLGIPGKAGGKEISGSNMQDRVLMGLLRSVADAVVVGAGTLREGKGEPLTAAGIFPSLRTTYSALRTNIGKESDPLAVVVTSSGDLNMTMPLFNGDAGSQVLIVTTQAGEHHLRKMPLPQQVNVASVETRGTGAKRSIPPHAIMQAIAQVRPCSLVLLEGGPHLLGDFFADGAIDEQFLTLSPQILGRDGKGTSGKRLNLVEGHAFAPEHPLWGVLSSVKQSASHLFLRYTFNGRRDSQ